MSEENNEILHLNDQIIVLKRRLGDVKQAALEQYQKLTKELQVEKSSFNMLQKGRFAELEEARQARDQVSQARDQVSKNYTRKCADVDEAVDFLWNLYDSVVNNEKIDRDDLRYLLSVLMRD